MKKLISLLLLLISSLLSNAQSIMIGAGGSYGTSIEQFAPNFRLYYGLNEHLCFGPEFSYFPTSIHGDESIQLTEYGFVAHYIFELKEHIGIYPLLGINYSVEESNHLGSIHTQNVFGASIGAGIHMNIKNIYPFIEYKYLTGALSQNSFSLGIIYNFHLKHESKE